MFYCFRQNNSGGSFSNDDNDGIAEVVIIEATDANHANVRAESIGLYFNGCDNDMDCPCCGDRWWPVDESDGTNEPSLCGEHIKQYKNDWFDKVAFVHYLDGSKEKIELPATKS